MVERVGVRGPILDRIKSLCWSHQVHSWHQGQSVGLGIGDDLNVSTFLGITKIQYAQTWQQNWLSNVGRY